MFIKEGDILQGVDRRDKTVVIHGCNCFHIMGAGIAAYLRRRYPEVYLADLSTPRGDALKLGTYSIAKIHDNLLILNCYTQYTTASSSDLKPPVDYEAIRQCLRKISVEFNGWYIRTPKIGCGLAGGDWDIVEKIFDDELANNYVTLYYL